MECFCRGPLLETRTGLLEHYHLCAAILVSSILQHPDKSMPEFRSCPPLHCKLLSTRSRQVCTFDFVLRANPCVRASIAMTCGVLCIDPAWHDAQLRCLESKGAASLQQQVAELTHKCWLLEERNRGKATEIERLREKLQNQQNAFQSESNRRLATLTELAKLRSDMEEVRKSQSTGALRCKAQYDGEHSPGSDSTRPPSDHVSLEGSPQSGQNYEEFTTAKATESNVLEQILTKTEEKTDLDASKQDMKATAESLGENVKLKQSDEKSQEGVKTRSAEMASVAQALQATAQQELGKTQSARDAEADGL
ncbi:hypothetical protein AK812_SmicGene44839 [Symbiodinium microadriaticum]|uniref:Uncharacterized protein n=1 Tax=Symbiodinium microadriaticum TaxID=2951 RepID=A0A1Q9BXH8_SYMMI|nr:hypothetical protein AK812_SmicGene44839 [Symbiodinium microadriaticum]